MSKDTSIQGNLKSFLDSQGRLTSFPAKRKRKIYALFYLAEKFQPDTIYNRTAGQRAAAVLAYLRGSCHLAAGAV